MSGIGSKILPSLVSVGAIGGVIAYVANQLQHESETMDGFFSSYNTPESEESRRKVFEGAQEDPRTNILNALGHKR